MIEKYARWAAWTALVLIVAFTVLPAEFRPHFGRANVERFAGFAVAGVLFGLAYPRRFGTVVAVLLASAVLLETVQLLVPGRDGTLPNLVIKLAGAALGLGTAALANAGLRRLGTREPTG